MYHCIFVSQYRFITLILYSSFTVFLFQSNFLFSIFLSVALPVQSACQAAGRSLLPFLWTSYQAVWTRHVQKYCVSSGGESSIGNTMTSATKAIHSLESNQPAVSCASRMGRNFGCRLARIWAEQNFRVLPPTTMLCYVVLSVWTVKCSQITTITLVLQKKLGHWFLLLL